MANKKKHQIRVTLTEENYTRLKQSSEKNYRTLTQEVNYRLSQILTPIPLERWYKNAI